MSAHSVNTLQHSAGFCVCTVLWTACCNACMASTEATKQTVLWRASSSFPSHTPLSIGIVCLPTVWARCLFSSLCCSVSWTLDALPERQAPKQRSKLFYDVRLVLFLFMPPSPSLFCVCPQCEDSACFCVRAVFHELCSAMPEQHQAVAGMVPEWRLPPGHQHLHQQHEGQSCQGWVCYSLAELLMFMVCVPGLGVLFLCFF